MTLRLRIEALYNALASIDAAISALEALREQQEEHREPITSSSLEKLITEREKVMQAIAHIEKVAHARWAIHPRLPDGAANDLAARARCCIVSRRHS
jgi:hypothetical protein